jgi:anaerobic selenocysteine-containing dehydrogenase
VRDIKLTENKLLPSLPFKAHIPYTWDMSLSHSPITKIRVGCPAHNCGGRCLLIAHIEDGKIIRLDTDDRPDTIAAPQLRACARGRAYLR